MWLFSAPVDLGVFLGSAVVSLILLAVGAKYGLLRSETPDWTWISAVLLIDVAHVWASNFRVYFDVEEVKRRVWLYLGVPVGGYLIGVALYSESALLFWRVLAYIAVFHFVRQQFGWVSLYRAKLRETNRLTFYIDATAIYLATIYPLVYWHANLPRKFEWFVTGDFARDFPVVLEKILFPVYVASLVLYCGKSVYLYISQRFANFGKDIVVGTTAICWYLGIVAFNSDYAFTVTNVIIHGVPYFALVYWYARSRRATASSFYQTISGNWLTFLLTLWALAYIEELFWHRGIWHERNWLFGADFEFGNLKMFIVPLLALPQLTHYVLDGFIWRRRNNANFKLV